MKPQGDYDGKWTPSEDYELFVRMLTHCRAVNLQQPLVEFRKNPRGQSATATDDRRARTAVLRERAWARLGVAYDPGIALELSRFVKGKRFRKGELRDPACCACFRLLHRFAVAPRPYPRPGDDAHVRRLVRTTVERLLAEDRIDFARVVAGDDLAWGRSLVTEPIPDEAPGA